MQIVLNGVGREIDETADLAHVLSDAGLPERGVAVAVDGEVVPRRSWSGRTLSRGARVEVLTAVQGG